MEKTQAVPGEKQSHLTAPKPLAEPGLITSGELGVGRRWLARSCLWGKGP